MKTKILILTLLITHTACASETDYKTRMERAIRQYGEEPDPTRRGQIGNMLEWLSRRNKDNRTEVAPPDILDIGKELGLASDEKFNPKVLHLTLERFAIGNPPISYIYFLT